METSTSPSPASSRRRLTVPRLAAWVVGVALFVAAADALMDLNIPSAAMFALAATLLVPPIYAGIIARANAKKPTPVMSRTARAVTAGMIAGIGLMLSGLDEALSSPAADATPEASIAAAPGSPAEAPGQPTTLDQSIRAALPDGIRGRVRSVKLVPYDAADIARYGLAAGATGVIVELNGSPNLTGRMTKGSAYSDAEKVFAAAFGRDGSVADVSVQFYYETTDKYGQESDSLGILLLMARPLFEKVNFGNISQHDLPAILESESSADDRNAYIERIRFD